MEIKELPSGKLGKYDYALDTTDISPLGIEKRGLLAILAHELAHKYSHNQAADRNSRFLREFALEVISCTYYAVKRRYGKRWIQHRGVLEMFAYTISRYVSDESTMPKGWLMYCRKWFPKGGS